MLGDVSRLARDKESFAQFLRKSGPLARPEAAKDTSAPDAAAPRPPKRRRCGNCGQVGHYAPRCPAKPSSVPTDSVVETRSRRKRARHG